jgi:hypothetical protein
VKIGAFNPRSPLTAVAICCAKAALLSDDIFDLGGSAATF